MTGFLNVMEKMKNIQDQKVANFVRLYPWFSNCQTHFAVVHKHFLSLYDIDCQSWEHVGFFDSEKYPVKVVNGFRTQKDNEYHVGIVLETNKIRFVNVSTAKPEKIEETKQ
jgi:hypothetical protein